MSETFIHTLLLRNSSYLCMYIYKYISYTYVNIYINKHLKHEHINVSKYVCVPSLTIALSILRKSAKITR